MKRKGSKEFKNMMKNTISFENDIEKHVITIVFPRKVKKITLAEDRVKWLVSVLMNQTHEWK